MSARAAYDELVGRAREAALLASCSSLLGWDEQTYMPHAGAEHRGRQMALLAGLHHEKATAPRIGELLDSLENDGATTADPTAPEAVNVRELRRGFDRATRLPRDLVEALARTASLAQSEWVVARQEKSFSRFLPWLDTMVGLKRQEADCLADGKPRYDALLDEYEPGARSEDLAPLFATLRDALVPLVSAIVASPRQPDATILKRAYPVERQRIFGEAAAGALGFDFQRGRLDTAAHPFCSGIGPGDCRLTTRYNPTDFTDSFFGILHETGHGLYDQGLDPAHFGTPMGDAVSLGVHESQSRRLWENAVGRSRPFWEHFFPIARQVFHDGLHDVTLDAFLFAVNRVGPSLIRVQADEVTYNLHILIRFELERALIDGALQPADVPGAWNEAYARCLGLTPRDDAEGCLQDIHWSAGLFGYFPTYTLGNIFAAQLYARAEADLGSLDQSFARGRFDDLLAWLREKVHHHGQRYRSSALIEHATGAPPDPRPLVAALTRKYGALYGLKDS